MSSVVVDASIAVKWVLDEPDSARARALLGAWASQGVVLLAPALLAYELANILRQQNRRNILTLDEAREGLRRVLLGGIHFDSAMPLALSTRALELADRFGLSAVYDAHYLALAEREGCEYWTADERLWNSVRAQLGWVRWLGEYSAAGSPTAVP